jgi:hypothetical protein
MIHWLIIYTDVNLDGIIKPKRSFIYIKDTENRVLIAFKRSERDLRRNLESSIRIPDFFP